MPDLHRKALMIANYRSGSAKRLPQALVMLEDAGIQVTSVRFTLTREAISRSIDEARDQGVDLVLACGGDGTVGTVVDAIVAKDMTLGIVAAGTSNNIARTMGVRPTVRGSVTAIGRGRETRIDVGEVNGYYFAHAAILGLNVDFAREAQSLRKVIGRLSYPVASLLVFRKRTCIPVHIHTDGSVRELKTYQLAVMNTPDFGGPLGLEVPGVSSRNKMLRVLSVEDLRLRTILVGLPRIFFRRHLGLPGAEAFDLVEGTLRTPAAVPLTLDGEIRTHTPASVRVVPGALRVIVGENWGKS